MGSASDASTQAAAAARLRTTADARERPAPARAMSLAAGRDRVIALLAPEDVPGAILAARMNLRAIVDATRFVAMGDLMESGRSLLAASRATAPTPGADGEATFSGGEALYGAGAEPSMAEIVPSTFLLFTAIRVTIAPVATTAATAAGIISDATDSMGIGVFASGGSTWLVGWLGSAYTAPVEITLGRRYRVELGLAGGALTLRARSTTYLGETGSVGVGSFPALSAGAIQIGRGHGEGFAGALTYLLVTDGSLSDRDLRGHRAWADVLYSDDALLLETGDYLLMEDGFRLLME